MSLRGWWRLLVVGRGEAILAGVVFDAESLVRAMEGLAGVTDDVRIVVGEGAAMTDGQVAVLEAHAQDDQVLGIKFQIWSENERQDMMDL
jgi:hypothetical protein